MSKKYQILVIISLLAVSCNSANKLHKMMDKLPEASAKECAQRFPIKETIETVTVADTALLHQYEIEFEYMAGLIDSLLSANCDTVKVEKIKNVITKIPCKPTVKYVIKTKENTAKQQVIIDSCQKMSSLLHKKLDIETQKVKELTDKNEKLSRQRNELIWLLIVSIILTFRKVIIRFIKPL
jgi:hypothetical protein